MVGVFFVFYVGLVVIVEPLTMRYGNLGDNYDHMRTFQFTGILKTFPTAVFGYTCQPNTQDIFAVIFLI